tara:strand:+ start:958 stop:1386 length:429 start_codon:yes stop_codon:yes gene_type:complete
MVRELTDKHLRALNRGRKAKGLKPIRKKKTKEKAKIKKKAVFTQNDIERFNRQLKNRPKKASEKSNLEIRKEKPHEIYPTKPANMTKSKWEALYKPQYVVQEKQRTMPDGTVRGMAYYRETTLKKAQATKKALERKFKKSKK